MSEQREKGELKPLGLQHGEEFIIREVQSKLYMCTCDFNHVTLWENSRPFRVLTWNFDSRGVESD